ncbi:MAG: YggS family pyridoxal phosphate-dependent enzyme [Chloroflexi bacterium]|uniref:Pyridoxal phosphate homeostasis protein n=1 Tax=Candidatus Chlorohelix allophototropha TaxID=3003348 RepID=A0A8T7LZN4_9CHLR|nr:YggS family pyridoxal phosphate-dependent enzyme [Chloroflexota bacterium]WJW67639.1 YggS family pyridoxal phosphate-dependent enzyme [Chloroflexota bacterium L227-S17]
MSDSLADKLARVRERINKAALRAGRKPEEITLVGVTKTVGREVIEEACRLGLTDFGENRIGDAEDKFTPLPYIPNTARLHLIGHLQTNKAKRAVAFFDMVHSVDSLRLAEMLDYQCGEQGKIMPALLEVNVSGESSKHGFSVAELESQIAALLELRHLQWRGLMTMAPFVFAPEETRHVFRELRTLFDKIRNNVTIPHWKDLSMGMTNDFEIAIEEGATLVRIGRAIF